MNEVLVTGGAGYIGSHVVQQLVARGEHVVVIDNLSTGFRDAVRGAELVVGSVGDGELVARVMGEHHVDAVLHFAAHTVVPESVSNPLKYYGNNTCNTQNLLTCCAGAGVGHFIFSSTAAVYGATDSGIADEDTPTQPINPYGASKLMSETMLRDFCATGAMRHVILRYFNVAGCDPQGRIGHSTPQATLLIKVACEHAVGKRASLSIFGTDYGTPDGTGIRDYIHVEDLARAHVLAGEWIAGNTGFHAFNLGTGNGTTVFEIAHAVAAACGSDRSVQTGPRRAGDPPILIADPAKALRELGWKAERSDIDTIVRTALAWHQRPRLRSNLPQPN